MTDLIKRLRLQSEHIPVRTLFDDAADRIEELNERLTAATDDAKEAEAYAQELEERNKELTLQLLATSGQAADALDKLIKAVAFIRRHIPDSVYEQRQRANAFLAELEGGEEATGTAWRGRE